MRRPERRGSGEEEIGGPIKKDEQVAGGADNAAELLDQTAEGKTFGVNASERPVAPQVGLETRDAAKATAAQTKELVELQRREAEDREATKKEHGRVDGERADIIRGEIELM